MAINFYIPSESYIVLNKDTWMPEIQRIRFSLIQGVNGIMLHGSINDCYTRSEIPESMCQALLDNNDLTVSTVNKQLEPYKKAAVERLTSYDNMVNVSILLSSARGYVTKNGQHVILFDQNALQADPFNDMSSLRFFMPFHTRQALLLTSEEYITRPGDALSFMLYTKEQLLQINCTYKDGLFYMQNLSPVSDMSFQQYFEAGQSLDFIYKRITGKKGRLKSLVNNE